MTRASLFLAVAGMALSAVQAASAANPVAGGQQLRTVSHGPFLIAEAYFADARPYAPDPVVGQIQPNNRWCGGDTPTSSPNTTAAPGVLSLCTRPKVNGDLRQVIDLERFATCPSGFGNAFVQSARLIKKIPGSKKCPGLYQAQTFVQFGTTSSIRTWWTLTYTSPYTTFTLELTVRCRRTSPPFDVELHVDRWVWRVVVTLDSLQAVIDVLHSNSIGTSEIPCIAAEDMYLALKQSVERIRHALGGFVIDLAPAVPATNDPIQRRLNAQDEVFNFEALLIAFCTFADCFDSSPSHPGGGLFSTFPPSNDVQMSPTGSLTGVLDTPENPCCCKLIADIEELAETYGIVSLDETVTY